MDMNLAVLGGKLAAPPELREFDSGSRLLRVLVTVRSSSPRRRVDVIPVTTWDPAEDHPALATEVGQRLWVTGTVQRRFWSTGEQRQSRLEVVSFHMQRHDDAAAATTEMAGGGSNSDAVD